VSAAETVQPPTAAYLSATAGITSGQIAANTLTDSNFASSAGMYSAYRTVVTAHSAYLQNLTAGDYMLGAGNVLGETTDRAVSGSSLPQFFYLDDADFAISGRTLKLRVRAQVYTNATAPAITFTAGLFPVSSVTGGVQSFQATLGAVTSGSTVAIATPSASTSNQGNSGDFVFPADGHYVLGVTFSGTIAGNASGLICAQLQRRLI
jgi:hypothetical protein